MKLHLLVGIVFATHFDAVIPKYSTECFFEQLSHGDRLEVSFESKEELDFKIDNPDGSLLHSVDRHREAAFGFYAGSTGQHSMCFSNAQYNVDKRVSFSFVGPDDLASIKAPTDANEEEKLLAVSIQTLSNDIRRIERHNETAKSTYSRVFWWSFVQLFILAGAVTFQVSYLRRIFEKKRLI